MTATMHAGYNLGHDNERCSCGSPVVEHPNGFLPGRFNVICRASGAVLGMRPAT